MTINRDNFKGASWFHGIDSKEILLVGLGGIGSNTLSCITKSLPAKYFIIDNDIIDSRNIGTQHYKSSQIGMSKVQACINNNEHPIQGFTKLLEKEDILPITIMAVDNMKARKLAFDAWRLLPDRKILIDGRLTKDQYEVYAVTPGLEDEYANTLFEGYNEKDNACTYRQTYHFGQLIGARITHILCNYFTNINCDSDICVVPFLTSEFGGCMDFKAVELCI